MRTKGFGVMHSLGIIALLFGAAFAQPVFADTYTINFTTVAGSPTPSGSFTYDASAPLGSQFTNFIVDWYGYSIDLTSSANNPTVDGTECGTSPNSAASFAFLSGSVPCSPNVAGPEWAVETDAPGPNGFAIFQFADDGTTTLVPIPQFNDFAIGDEAGLGTAPNFGVTAQASGTWTITDTTTPEPGTMVLFGGGLLGMAGLIRRKLRL
jgi:hypothetical protein